MGERRLRRLGRMRYSRNGAILLINEKGEAYIVDDAVVDIWRLADGRTVREMTRIVASKLSYQYRGLKEQLRRLVDILVECGLLSRVK